ncbi:hypothetical protein Tsubulata_001315 [Turnera subulata]|uniref:Uncharacterized protein n=2 Tax=Turnera subulata TaxID=218843 RepID=A0A9Q0FG02_9ROSI|nr:hypothetical protein Tsubulata_001315 [Turnera subulata]
MEELSINNLRWQYGHGYSQEQVQMLHIKTFTISEFNERSYVRNLCCWCDEAEFTGHVCTHQLWLNVEVFDDGLDQLLFTITSRDHTIHYAYDPSLPVYGNEHFQRQDEQVNDVLAISCIDSHSDSNLKETTNAQNSDSGLFTELKHAVADWENEKKDSNVDDEMVLSESKNVMVDEVMDAVSEPVTSFCACAEHEDCDEPLKRMRFRKKNSMRKFVLHIWGKLKKRQKGKSIGFGRSVRKKQKQKRVILIPKKHREESKTRKRKLLRSLKSEAKRFRLMVFHRRTGLRFWNFKVKIKLWSLGVANQHHQPSTSGFPYEQQLHVLVSKETNILYKEVYETHSGLVGFCPDVGKRSGFSLMYGDLHKGLSSNYFSVASTKQCSRTLCAWKRIKRVSILRNCDIRMKFWKKSMKFSFGSDMDRGRIGLWKFKIKTRLWHCKYFQLWLNKNTIPACWFFHYPSRLGSFEAITSTMIFDPGGVLGVLGVLVLIVFGATATSICYCRNSQRNGNKCATATSIYYCRNSERNGNKCATASLKVRSTTSLLESPSFQNLNISCYCV